ncbi:Na+/H+ antiporter subunit E [Aeromicrobium phragmitis]|uniref:Na+/H+ antiporter subunit E n=1 Tax=Aeromicrobium phragmitis TaxID=2478914 RepID=A0A3L8PI46_9ACTN|nr:Na+/H+ antiporter subunit E [Aeromicrobium phragmitis]RLV55006.1 Na+/H+ antiporter subunit E [Aeromicrobium phragmitis]
MNVVRVPVILALTIVWAMLWGEVTPLNIVGGLLISTLVVVVFPFPPVNLVGTVRPLGLLVLFGRFLYDLVVASFQVAWTAIRPGAPPKSAVIEVHLVSRSDLLQVLTGEFVSLVPGSLLIELDADNGRMWLHVLDGSTPRRVDTARRKARAQEHRVIAAFGSRDELEASTALLREDVSA